MQDYRPDRIMYQRSEVFCNVTLCRWVSFPDVSSKSNVILSQEQEPVLVMLLNTTTLRNAGSHSPNNKQPHITEHMNTQLHRWENLRSVGEHHVIPVNSSLLTFRCNFSVFDEPWGLLWCSWLRHSASRKSRVQFPMRSLRYFITLVLLARTMGHGVYPTFNRSISWVVKAAGARGWQSYHRHVLTV